MKLFTERHVTLKSILFLTLFVITLWQFPFAITVLSITFLLFGLAAAISSIFKKHRDAYCQDKITRGVFIRNVFLEIFGILLAMTLAGLLGKYLAQMATEPINNELTKLITAIVIGLLAGMGVGVLVNRTWGRLAKSFLTN